VTRFFDLKWKLKLWRNHVVIGNLEMFPLLLRLESEEEYQKISSLIENHLEELRNKIKHYFPLPFNTTISLGEEPLL
jgi:hypothetical protein